MKIADNRALGAEKKLYSQPQTTVQQMNIVHSICIGSVKGGTLQYGGQIANPAEFDPM